jgi:hypothetical protein
MSHVHGHRRVALWVRLALPIMAAAAVVSCASPGGSEEIAPSELVTYQPFIAAYVGSAHRMVQQEFDGQLMTNESAVQFFVHLEVAAAKDLLSASMVLDSVVQIEGPSVGMLPAQLDSARGSTFSGTLAPNGQIIDWSGGKSSGSIALQLGDQYLSGLLPVMPVGGVEEGTAWSDTVETVANIGGVEEAEVRAVRDHRAVGWSELAGARVLEIETESRYTFSGSGSQMGQPFAVDGAGTKWSTHYVTVDGRYLGSISADTTRAEADLTEAGIVIPVTMIRSDSIMKTP